LAGAVHTSIFARKGVSERIPHITTTTATAAIIERPMRFNEDLFRKETYCHGHWWAGNKCLYGAHSLIEEELLHQLLKSRKGSKQLSRPSRS
jgi:hypothetical protein